MKFSGGCLKTFLLMVAVTLGLVSCMSVKQLPQDRYYRLPLHKIEPAASPVFSGTVGVGRIETMGLLNERSILYSDQQSPLEIMLYRYHLWQEAPATLIQKNLRAYLQQSGLVERAVLDNPGQMVDQLIIGRLLQFERQLIDGGTQVVVQLELGLEPQSGNVYQGVEACADQSMAATADAFGRALEKIYRNFLRDISQ